MRNWRLWLGIGISVLFLVIVLRQVTDYGQALAVAQQANYWLVIPALIIYFVGVWVRSLRWHLLLKPIKALGARRLFPVVVMGYTANDVLPARMGEVVRAYVLGEREQVSKTASFATIVVERLFDGLTMLVFMGVVSLFYPFNEELQNIVRIGGIIFVAALAVVLLVAASPRLTSAMLRVVLRIVPARFRSGASNRLDSFVKGLLVMQSARSMAGVVALSLTAWLLEACMYQVLAIGFDLGTPFYVALLNTAVINLGTMIPSSPGYVGTFEALSVFTLGLFGVDSNRAFSYTVVLHAALVIPITLWGLYYFWRYNLSLVGAKGSRGSEVGTQAG